VRHEGTVENRLCAVALIAVLHHRVGHVVHVQAPLFHAVAPVHVLEVQKEALVHHADAVDGLAPHEHGGTQHPVDFARRRVVEIEHQVVAERLGILEQPAQRGPAQQQNGEGVEAAARKLDGAVLEDEFGARDAGAGCALHELDQFDVAPRRTRVGVQDEQ
jgi:hypothetical protein